MSRFYSTQIGMATLAALAIVAFTETAAANEYPWCAQYGGGSRGGARNCGFVSFEQCMQTVHGIGGFCDPNLFYSSAAERPLKRARKHRDG